MFLHGDHDPEKWHPFDTQGSGILDTFADWNAAHPCADIPAPTPQPEPQPETGGGQTMSYIDRYPTEYRSWVAAGGAENNFRKHIMAISGDYVPTPDDIKFLADELKAGIEQLGLALAKRPFAS
jgi:hypothetical protein